jgi:small-conductance mechanosensitive channel
MHKKRGWDQWSARFAMRLIGTGILAVVIVMAFLGAFVLDLTKSFTAFFIFWTVFFLLMLTAIAIAMLDALATIGKFRREHAKLRSTFHRKLSENDDSSGNRKREHDE